MAFLSPVTLRGAHAALAPLSHGHLDGLVEAARDGELWRLWYTLVPKPEGMHAEIERRLALQARESMLPFTVLDADGRIAGMTTYMNVDASTARRSAGSPAGATRTSSPTTRPYPSGCSRGTKSRPVTASTCAATFSSFARVSEPYPRVEDRDHERQRTSQE
jgi:hypothetical protein